MSNAVAVYLTVLSQSAGKYMRLYLSLKLMVVLNPNALQNEDLTVYTNSVIKTNYYCTYNQYIGKIIENFSKNSNK